MPLSLPSDNSAGMRTARSWFLGFDAAIASLLASRFDRKLKPARASSEGLFDLGVGAASAPASIGARNRQGMGISFTYFIINAREPLAF